MTNNLQLIKNKQKAVDEWCYVDDEAALTDAPSIISFARLLAEGEALRARNAPLGVVVRADNQGKTKQGEDARLLAPYLDMLSLVAVDFPAYRNGRGYSTGRVLREELGFEGELRAIGEVLHDQWQFMARCGFDAFEIDAGTPIATFNEALEELSDAYQPATDTQRGALWKRGGG